MGAAQRLNDPPARGPASRQRARSDRRASVVDLVGGLCPYLVAGDGHYRSSIALGEHRCTAVEPMSAISLDKQRRLCLTPGHAACATYLAAAELRAASVPHAAAFGPPDADSDAPIRPLVQTIPIVLDGHRTRRGPALFGDRRIAQGALVALMAVALGAIVYARGIVPAADKGAPSSSPAPTALAASPTTSPSPATPSPTLAPSPSPSASLPPPGSPSPSLAPSTGPSPSAARTYTVRAGDTLIAIAARFNTTAVQLKTLNHITDARSLRVGQVLVLP